MENNQETALSALMEDYKTRWDQYLKLEEQVNHSGTLYASALVLAIGWILSGEQNSNFEEIMKRGNNCYFVLTIALLNSVYALTVAFKGFQCQQINLYLYDVVGARIRSITNEPFNTWENWRRKNFRFNKKTGSLERIRGFYYFSIGILPFAASVSILWLYWYYAGSDYSWSNKRNIYFYFVCFMALCNLVACISTISTNRKWLRVLSKSGRDINQKQETKAVTAKTEKEHNKSLDRRPRKRGSNDT